MTDNEIALEEESRLNEEEEEYGLPPPPDGGYGWVIVFASFMCNLVVDGIGYSFGMFLPELVNFFGVGKGTVAWIGSILAGSLLAVGPIISALCNKYGCRAVCIAGSLISTVAFVLCTFTSNVIMMMLIYGLMGGIGFGMIYLPSVVAVGYYFDTRRSLATGIAVCGSGVGTFSFAPLALFLLKTFGSWQGATLILAGLIFNCAVFGALMRPLTYPKKKEKPLLERMAEEKRQHMATGSIDCINEKLPAKPEGLPQKLLRNVSSPAFSSSGMPKNGSVPSFDRKNSVERTAKLSSARPRAASKASVYADTEGQVYNSKMSVEKEPPKMIRPLSRKDIFYSGSIVNLPQYQSQKSLQGFRNSMLSLQYSRGAGDLDRHEPIKTGAASMFDVSLLKDPAFMLIGLSSFFGMAAVYVPFVYMADAATLNGVDQASASFLVSIIGITNTVARIGCGFIADFPWVDSLLLNNLCLVLATVSVAFLPFCASYGSYVAVAVAFGVAIAGFISLTSIILVDLLGLDKLTNAFGLLILFRGAATFIGSPLAGAIYDGTKSYDVSFYMAAVFFLLSALASFTAPRFRKKKEEVYGGPVLSPISEEEAEEEEEEDEPLTMHKSKESHTRDNSQQESVM